MSMLTIEFRQMFLLVNRKNGASVLLPSEKHTATLTGKTLAEPITLNGVTMWIRENKVDVVDRPTLRPGARYLPFLDYVFHADIVPRESMSDLKVPRVLNARVLLTGGYLTELPAADPQVADIIWDFKKADGQVMLRQALTDRLVFTLPLDADTTYELVMRSAEAEEIIPIPADGADFVLTNMDEGVKRPSDNGWHTLTEYALLYNLTTASTLTTLYPYPTADTSRVGGGTQPICGGGQTDDDGEDPPPPVL